jgi:hypothetical protein
MCQTVAEVRAHALALLLGGKTPEEVEAALVATSGTPQCILDHRPLTSLTDPNNDPVFKEVTDHGAAEGAG